MQEARTFTPVERGLIATAAAIVFARVFAFSLVLPGFRAFGATLTDSDLLVGTALGAYGATMALAQLGMGALSDRIGRRPVLLLGSLLFIAGSIWAAMAGSIGTLIAARLLQGAGGVSSAALAAVGETVPESRRTTAMAMIGIPAGLGFFFGFVAGPILEPFVGFRGLFWLTAALGVATMLPLVRRLPAPRTDLVAVSPRPLGLPVIALCAAGFVINYGMSNVAFFLSDRAVSSAALAGILLVAFVAMGIGSRVADRSRATWQPVALGLTSLAAGAPLFLLGAGLTTLWVGGSLFFAGHALLSAVLPSQVSRLAGRSGGRGHGIQLVVSYTGSAAGGVAAGWFANEPAEAFILLALLAVAAAVLTAASLAAPKLEVGTRVGENPP